ncbi:vam6/Vps39-like protein [Danio aesculapii]|uniref:vam6/Vps39-like protein n=1 Tax=Danio aesculapii TaxID=1142201 RepID=UPI0024BF6766|nr:vam6/Vps39-like protein [Danio aesculapii]
MHDAYEPVPILEKLPLQIDCLAAWDDWLLVGTKPGHLLQYRIKKDAGTNRFEVTLEKSNKNFSKKIQQLFVVSQYKILVSLLENNIHVHDLLTFQQITVVSKAKGATLFACDLQQSESGEAKLRMCVAVKKKIQLYYWKDREFHELQGDVTASDFPKSMAWCENSICVGSKRDYYLIRMDGRGSIKELFPTGKQLEPLVAPLADGKVAVGQDDLTVVLNEEGVCTQKCALNWTDIPVAMEHQPPYIIAVLPRYVEIRTVEPRLLVQSVELQRPRFITSAGSNVVYVASNHFVWRLVPVSIASQIRQLLQDKQFELALQLAKMKDDSDTDKRQQIHHIQNLFAFNLFCQKRFDDSMQGFAKLGTDPTHVIGLYPDLLPSDYRKQLHYPNPLPPLSGAELEKAHLALIDYLTQKRSHLVKQLNDSDPSTTSPLMEGTPTIKSRKKLLQIIDTTLLKCYLHVYLSLLRMYLSPPDVHFLGPIKMELCEPQANLQAALNVLQLHHSKLNTTKAINLLPANTQIREIQVFLESVLEEKAGRKRFDQVLKSLLQAEFLRVQEERIFHQQVKCVITDEKTCRVCKKKIGNSAFARYPNGVVVHYFCCKDRSTCPAE